MVQRAILRQRRREPQRVHVQQLCRYVQRSAVERVGADDDVIRIECLRQADGGGAGWLKAQRQPEMIERVLAIAAADHLEACGAEPLIQNLGHSLADPVEAGLPGAIVKGQRHQQARVLPWLQGGRIGRLGGGPVQRGGRNAEQRQQCQQGSAQVRWKLHAAAIIVRPAGAA